MYYNKEVAGKLVELEIQNRKDCLKLYDQIIPIIERFDGKVLNKRLETALQNVNKYLRVDRNYTSFGISWWVENDYIRNTPDRNGFCTACYVQSRQLYMTTALFTSDRNMTDKVMLDEENRLIADVILVALEQGKKNMEEHIRMLEESLPHAEEYEEELKAMKKAFEEKRDSIPYLIRDYYDMNYSITKR